MSLHCHHQTKASISGVISALTIFLSFTQSAKAYYTFHLRDDRPSLTDESEFRHTTGHLSSRKPGFCYLYRPAPGGGNVDYTIIYNRPGDVPISNIAFSRSRKCPQEKYSLSGRTIFVAALDPTNLEGVHVINVTAFGPDARFRDATYVSLDPNIPDGDPDGLLKDTANDERPATYAWLEAGGPDSWKRNRVYIPGTIEKIADPTNVLLESDPNTTFFYSHLREVVVRWLERREKREPDPENFEFTAQPRSAPRSARRTNSKDRLERLNPPTPGYAIARLEQGIQNYLQSIIDTGNTAPPVVENKKKPEKMKIKETENLVSYVDEILADIGNERETQAERVNRQLTELEELVGPLDIDEDSGDDPGDNIGNDSPNAEPEIFQEELEEASRSLDWPLESLGSQGQDRNVYEDQQLNREQEQQIQAHDQAQEQEQAQNGIEEPRAYRSFSNFRLPRWFSSRDDEFPQESLFGATSTGRRRPPPRGLPFMPSMADLIDPIQEETVIPQPLENGLRQNEGGDPEDSVDETGEPDPSKRVKTETLAP